MKQFNLSEWLKDKSRKVVTRDGRPVRIVCWDKLDDRPAAKEQKIVALVKEGCKENVFMYNDNGDGCISALDLFFADEEEELTEFEKRIYNLINFFDPDNCPSIKEVKEEAEILFDLARKEFESKRDRTCEEAILSQVYSEGYEQGKQDALKDLPKWKKSTLPILDEEYPTGFNSKYFCYKGYCVDYKKLFEILPKEETDE